MPGHGLAAEDTLFDNSKVVIDASGGALSLIQDALMEALRDSRRGAHVVIWGKFHSTPKYVFVGHNVLMRLCDIVHEW